jgi:D-3-phosphoglycerate dehydrogenase
MLYLDEPLEDAVMDEIRGLKKIGQAKLLSFDV